MNPVIQFEKWFDEELEKSNLKIPSACCFSTIGKDGYPNSRFVSLKEVKNGKFIVTGPLNSRKGEEVHKTPKVALTFWWTATERQVRIQGDACLISREEAIAYFEERNKDSRIVSVAFEQGKEIKSVEELNELFLKQKTIVGDKSVACPKHWGGFSIQPKRIEFMEFEESRLHKRTLFEYDTNKWTKQFLQP
ncbi:pyridoxamine 5'-phosphate oxidase [Flavobacteriaceae bacterium R38]|nr:pyridoxamine 5'-phosphate oxidase [Flavobacteriaceae bacterium R38]